MLFFYFLRKFYKNFILFFIAFVLIFAISDLFIRIPFLSSLQVTPIFFLLMLPLMSQFSIPLASCLSVQMTCGNLHIADEVLFFYFFSSARKALRAAVLIFSLSIVVIYIPLIFIWAPQSYKKGKEFILNFAKDQFFQLEAGKFHTPVPGFTFFFKSKKTIKGRLVFQKLLLMFNEKDGKKYLINAQNGFLLKDSLFLQNGVIQNLDSDKFYLGNFEQTEISLKKLFDKDQKRNIMQQLKFCTWKNLKKIKNKEGKAYIEYHKRIAQVCWQFLFPFLGLWGIMIFGRRKSNLLLSIFLSGALFLFSYISLNLAQILYKKSIFTIFLLYFPIILIGTIFYCFYRKKR